MMATENPKTTLRPRLLLAHPRLEYADQIRDHYGQLGWQTHYAVSARDARNLARELAPSVIVLSTDLPDESGWLTCDKILSERPRQKIILVTEHSTPTNRCFAQFVGATALVNEEAGVEGLAEQVGSRLSLALGSQC